MKIGITSKLFIALLATCLMMIFVMSTTLCYTFERGLLTYVNTEDVSRSGTLLRILADNYKENGGWQWLREDPRHWGDLLREKYGPPPFPPGPPPGEEHDHDDEWHERPADVDPKNLLPDQLNLAPRVTVLDEHERYLAGNPEPAARAPRRPIAANGATVGWLVITPYSALTNAVAVTFRNQQRRVAYVISGVSALLAVFIAMALARTFLAPIKRLAGGMRLLAAGDYLQSIPISSGDEMGRLAEDFNRLALTLQKSDLSRRQWVADISHELRTPLAILRGEVEALQDGIRPLGPGSIKSLHAEVMVLNKLVNDLYDLSMSDAGALAYRKENVDVLAIVERTLSSYREAFGGRNIIIESLLEPDGKAIIFADEMRLGQLFANLLQNALRYTDPGGKLRVSCERENGRIVIDFHDTPPGVPADALPRLFERLYRVDEARSRERGGAGLGLSICKNIVEAHDGTIEARPSPLGGLWLRVAFPLAD